MFCVHISGEVVPGMDQSADNMEAELGFQQVPVLQQNLAARLQQQQVPLQAGVTGGLQPPSSPYDEAELDALAEIERIEREAASEKCSKEVQDKGVQYISLLYLLIKVNHSFLKFYKNLRIQISNHIFQTSLWRRENKTLSPRSQARGDQVAPQVLRAVDQQEVAMLAS